MQNNFEAAKLTFTSSPKPLNGGEKRTWKRKFPADMFSESPYVRALAFSKHHILSVNNLVFVRISVTSAIPELFRT